MTPGGVQIPSEPAVRRKRRLASPIISATMFVAVLIALFVWFYTGSRADTMVDDQAPSRESGEIEVFFTAPWDPVSGTLRGGPDAYLAASISSAHHSVEIAAYDLDLWSVRDALIDARRAGALVRVVVERSNFESPEIQALIRAGIEVVPDEREPLMHHKFVVVDRWEVWTGSMNFTLNGAYRNDNNLLHLQSRELAQNYAREFEEMFVDNRFGGLSKQDTPFPVLNVGAVRINVYFSPEDGALEAILQAVREADEQVLVLAYTLTADELTELLIEKSRQGIDVRVVIEGDQINSTGNDFARLVEAGVDARMDRNPYNMHHKVILIDGETVISGSYNFTRSAEERNDENLIIIHDPDLGTEYLVEFTRIWDMTGR